MNQYTQIIYRIKEIAEPLVNTITRGNFEDIDISKQNIYPLLHIFVQSGGFNNGSTVTFDLQLGCFQQRNYNNTYEIDKLWDNDNEVDNMNETHAILNTVWNVLLTDFEKENITASENPTLDPVTNGFDNGLDGWILNFTIEVPNTTLSLC